MNMSRTIPKQHCDTLVGGRSAAFYFGVGFGHLRFFVVADMGVIGLLIRNGGEVKCAVGFGLLGLGKRVDGCDKKIKIQ